VPQLVATTDLVIHDLPFLELGLGLGLELTLVWGVRGADKPVLQWALRDEGRWTDTWLARLGGGEFIFFAL
jgi:hypothetical protein